jgi:hypothetical protein
MPKVVTRKTRSHGIGRPESLTSNSISNKNLEATTQADHSVEYLITAPTPSSIPSFAINQSSPPTLSTTPTTDYSILPEGQTKKERREIRKQLWLESKLPHSLLLIIQSILIFLTKCRRGISKNHLTTLIWSTCRVKRRLRSKKETGR